MKKGEWSGRQFMDSEYEAWGGGFFNNKIPSQGCSYSDVWKADCQGTPEATSCSFSTVFSNCMADPTLSKGVKERVWF